MSEPVVYDGDDTDSSISDDEQPVRRRAVQNQQEEEENIQVSNVSLKRGKVKPEAQLYEAPAGKSHESEDDAGDEDGQEEEEHDEEDGEEAGEGEGEEGEWEGEKKEEVKKELDPWDVPTTGKFWLHDDRFDPANRGRGGRYKRRGRGGRGGKQLWEAEEPMWTHDKFEELEKEPEPIDDRNGRGRYSRGRGRGRRGRRYRGRGRGGRGYGRRGRGRGRGRWVKKDSVQNEKVQPSTLQHNAASFYPSGAGQGNQLPADPSVPNGSNHGVHAVPKFSQQEVKLKKSSETKHQPSRSQGKMNPKAKGFVPNMKSGDIQQQTAPHQIVPQSDGRFYDGSAQPVIDTAQPILQTGQQVLQTSEMPPAMPALLTGPNGEQQLVYGLDTSKPPGFQDSSLLCTGTRLRKVLCIFNLRKLSRPDRVNSRNLSRLSSSNSFHSPCHHNSSNNTRNLHNNNSSHNLHNNNSSHNLHNNSSHNSLNSNSLHKTSSMFMRYLDMDTTLHLAL
uniref:Btz domain-containing protein n=1 Tax=Lotharella globosa TaxID=91324 RepID=A0A7S4DG25_9EUKA